MDNSSIIDDDPPPEPRDGWLLVRIHVPELNVYKCLQFPADRLVWDVKHQVLASLPKELKESFNYGLFAPPSNGKAGKFLDEERRLGDYPFNGPVGYLELKYKRRVYKMLKLDERQLKALHTRANLRRFLECINGGHVEKIAKMCTKGLDPNFHCPESGETPLTVATGAKKPNKLLIALVNGGALLDYRTKDGSTALHKAVEKDSLEAVTTLLELGASPNYKDSRGLTPLYISITKKCDAKISESLLHDHSLLGIQDNQGWQEVHQACRHGLVNHLEHLLFYGADMDGRNASGNTPLHVCAVNNQEACARMLLFRGAQRGALNYANQTPYQVAVIAGNLELAEIIQNYKSDDIVPFRGPPRYNPRRRSGIGWMGSHMLTIGNNANGMNSGNIISTLTRNSVYGPPSPCPSEHMQYSSASSSLSEGSSGHRSHEDDISIITDKSLGEVSDIISDSSGVGTNSDSAACSIGHPSSTVVCMEPYAGTSVGSIRIQPGDVIEVVGSTDCGMLEGYVRGTNRSGFFPAECVQEVNIRQKNITNVSTSSQYQKNSSSSPIQQGNINASSVALTSKNATTAATITNGQYSSATTPRIKKPIISFSSMTEPRTVILHRAKRGFGFILRGAKASSPLMQLKPSDRFPALQYLDDVDPGGVADMAGLRPGDFLLAINGNDVCAASHEQVVDMIRSSGALVSMTVISPNFTNHMQPPQLPQPQQNHGMQQSLRQCATLPRKMSLGPFGKMPAPTPPRRDPKTTLSVGRARAKSMVAGLENGGEKDDEDAPAKSSSIESIATPILNPGTPVQFRTASIKARPTSSRITAAELEELFQRQQGETIDGSNRYSTMMTTSRFLSGTDSGAATPPNGSPIKGPQVYASVAEMKRKKNRCGGTLRGKPCPIPTISSELKRFHSTPDLNSQLNSSSSSIWHTPVVPKGHHSQDDVAITLHSSLPRLTLPAPTHPPPPPPVGQVVKVEVSRGEYESTVALQQSLKKRIETAVGNNATSGESVVSSFNPSANAKLYASPQDLRNVGWKRTLQENQLKGKQPQSQSQSPQLVSSAQQLSPQLHTQQQQQQHPQQQLHQQHQQHQQHLQQLQQLQQHQAHQQQKSQYAQPTKQMGLAISQQNHEEPQKQQYYQNPHPQMHPNDITTGPAPPIPEPDYSLSESDEDDENSILVARNTKLNEKIQIVDVPETSGNSNTSGTSSGSGSMAHSFSVEEIKKMRTKLKTSKSYSNELTTPEKQNDNSANNQSPNLAHNEEGDNSSSGVSSDQDIPTNGTDTIKKKPTSLSVSTSTPSTPVAKPKKQMTTVNPTKTTTTTTATPPPPSTTMTSTTKVKATIVNSQQVALSLAPAIATKINNNSATTKKRDLDEKFHDPQSDIDEVDLSPIPPVKNFQRQNSLTRKKATVIGMNRSTRTAVSLVKLPPPIEADSENEIAVIRGRSSISCTENIVLAPPPQFCDCNDLKHSSSANNSSGGGTIVNVGGNRVRIVGAVPKANRLH